jgi:uncharacterized damage-inducible protein DinB
MIRQSSEIRLLTELLTESFQSKAWHGPNLRGSLRGLTAGQPSRRPGSRRHSIWEIAVHCAYWKYIVLRRITGEKRGSFYLKGSNWFSVGKTPGEWKKDVTMLRSYHEGLLEAVRSMKPSDLRRTPKGSTVSTAAILRGIASHDVYHAGQIQLIKRLIR